MIIGPIVWIILMAIIFHQLRIRRFDVLEAVLLAILWPLGLVEIIITPKPKGTGE